MARGHWGRLRTQGGGPRGGGGGHDKGPLRKIVRHRKIYIVTVLPRGKASVNDWVPLLETEDYSEAANCHRLETESGRYEEVRLYESGWREVLECGHDQMPVHDLIGETNAARRCCSKCKRGLLPDVPVSE